MKPEILLALAKPSLEKVTKAEWRQYPVWVETDNWQNEDEVAPCVNSHLLNYGGGICYVHSQFILKNNLSYEGYIRLSKGLVTAIFISVEENDYVGHSLLEENRRLLNDTEERLASLLGLKVENVFPISYECLAEFADAPNLLGLIEK